MREAFRLRIHCTTVHTVIAACVIAVAVGAFLPLLMGCGEKQKQPMEIVVWEQKDPEEQLLLRRHLDAFMEKHPGLVISTLHFETDQLHSQFQTAALAGGGPDLVYGPSDKVGPYSVMGLIKPLEGLFDASFFELYESSSVAVLDGHIYAVPDQIGNHLMLLYNKELVTRVPGNSDEWIAICRENTVDLDGNGIPDRYGLVFNFNEPFWLIPFIGGFGGWVMNADGAPTLNTEAVIGALRFLADLRNHHKVIPRESNYEVSDTMFKQGMAAFIINGPWSIKAYVKAGIDLGIIPLPVITATGRHPTPMVSSKGYSININVDEARLSIVKELLVYLTSKEVQREIATELLILPSLKDLYQDQSITQHEILRGSLEQSKLGRPMPLVPEMRAIWDAIRPFYQSVLGGQMTPEDAAEQMQERAEKKIAEMRG
ncbi:MAG: extracellular solute-binding protein [bacterium]|nr:MAG: extracellular solute-binding protein [bacterium]